MTYLRNVLAVESAAMHVDRLRTMAPVIWLKIACYHWETRHRTVTTRSNGRTHTRHGIHVTLSIMTTSAIYE
jgi:hypothetical protein